MSMVDVLKTNSVMKLYIIKYNLCSICNKSPHFVNKLIGYFVLYLLFSWMSTVFVCVISSFSLCCRDKTWNPRFACNFVFFLFISFVSVCVFLLTVVNMIFFSCYLVKTNNSLDWFRLREYLKMMLSSHSYERERKKNVAFVNVSMFRLTTSFLHYIIFIIWRFLLLFK